MAQKPAKKSVKIPVIEVLLLLVVIVWGANYSVMKVGLKQLSPEDFTTLRFIVCSIIFFVICYFNKEGLRVDKKDIKQLLIIGLIGIAMYQTLFAVAVKYTTTSNSSLIMAMSPIFAALFAFTTKQENPKLSTVAGIGVSFVGVFLVIRYGMNQNLTLLDLSTLKGNIMAVLASITWALYPIFLKPMLEKYSAVKTLAYSSLFGSIFLLPFSFKSIITINYTSLTLITWFSLIYNILISTVYALAVWYYGIGKVGPTKVMVYMFVIPISAIVVAYFALNESINMLQAFGAAIVILGIYVVKKDDFKQTAVEG